MSKLPIWWVIGGLGVFISAIILLDKREERCKRRIAVRDADSLPMNLGATQSDHVNPEHRHPTEEEHRSHAEAHWHKQIVLERMALILSAIAAFAAVAAGYGAWRTYGQTREEVAQAKRQADAADAALRTTRDNFTAEERPYIWLTTNFGEPRLVQNKAGTWQVIWDYHYKNYGNTPALRVATQSQIKIDGTTFLPSFAGADGGHATDKGAPLPPTADLFQTAVSAPGITPSIFAAGLGVDRYFGISGTITYTDASGAKYNSSFCLERLASGAESLCATGNDIK